MVTQWTYVNRIDTKDFYTNFMLKTLDHIKVYESGELLITFMDGTEMELGGE